MWETIKNDPILKTVTIIILSVLGFGFAFNIMFGPNNSGMEHGEGMGGGYSLGNTLADLFILLFKLLLIALVVVALIALLKFTRKHLLDGGEIKMFESIKKDPVLKGVTVVLLLIVAFGLIYYLFTSLFGFGGYGMTGGYNSMGYASYGLGFAGLLSILLKFLLFASVAGLLIGLFMYVKQSYGKEIAGKLSTVSFNVKPSVTCKTCNAAVPGEFKFCPQCGANMKVACASCGTELKKEWKCCPVCGTEKPADSETNSEGIAPEIIEEIYTEDQAAGGTTKSGKGKRG